MSVCHFVELDHQEMKGSQPSLLQLDRTTFHSKTAVSASFPCFPVFLEACKLEREMATSGQHVHF